MTSAAPEPTDEQVLAAAEAVNWWHDGELRTDSATVARVARALAAAVAAERKKQYEAIEAAAKSVEYRMKHTNMALVNGTWAARRIREVSR